MDPVQAIKTGSANPLGLEALHRLVPGQSRTMMAASIVAVQGPVRQAVRLGAPPRGSACSPYGLGSVTLRKATDLGSSANPLSPGEANPTNVIV